MQPAQDFPATLPLLLSSGKDDNVCDERHALEHNGERHEEADGAPHGAEVAVAMAVLLLGEVVAGVCKGGTAPVKTVGVVYPLAAGLLGCCQ